MNALAPQIAPWWSASPGAGRVAGTLRDIVQQVLRASTEAPAPSTGTAFDVLEPTIRAEVWARWQEPCESAFEYLAENHPRALLLLVVSKALEPADLTFAAEIVGRIPLPSEVRTALLPLLHHEEAVVREGAVYGLASVSDDVVRRELARLARADESEAVRTAAADRLARS